MEAGSPWWLPWEAGARGQAWDGGSGKEGQGPRDFMEQDG